MDDSLTPERVFAQDPLALALVEHVRRLIADDAIEIRTTKSQVRFRRRRGFAYVWVPGHYLANPRTAAVLSIAFDELIDSPRFSEVAQPAPRVWMHHLDIASLADVDDEVVEWLHAASLRAA